MCFDNREKCWKFKTGDCKMGEKAPNALGNWRRALVSTGFGSTTFTHFNIQFPKGATFKLAPKLILFFWIIPYINKDHCRSDIPGVFPILPAPFFQGVAPRGFRVGWRSFHAPRFSGRASNRMENHLYRYGAATFARAKAGARKSFSAFLAEPPARNTITGPTDAKEPK